MRWLVALWPRDRRQAQAGATLVELLVSVTIMGLALTLIIGTFSTGLLQSSMAKRDTAAVAVLQYELDQISGSQFGALPPQYSDCFATESATSPPTPATGYRGDCPGSSYTLRVDVNSVNGPQPETQLWSVAVVMWPAVAPIGTPVQLLKGNR
jgi:type II secretory pathway pseudopilin PulG